MKLTDAQLRHFVCASDPPPGQATAGAETDPVIAAAVENIIKEPEAKIVDVRWATEAVIRAADDVVRAAQEAAPESQTAETSPTFEAVQSNRGDPGKFPVPVARPRSAHRRPLVPPAATSLVLLVSGVVGASVVLTVERSRSWVEASPSVALSEPEATPPASDRPPGQATTQTQTVAPSTSPRLGAPPASNARAADSGASRHAPPPASLGLNAAAPMPATAPFARSNGSPVRAADAAPANAGGGNWVGPQAQNQRTGGGPARVATLVPRTGGVGGALPQPPSPRQSAMALATAPGTGGGPARATSERLTTCLAARPAALRLSQNEIGKLFKRGEEYMGQGRISAARPLFQRAAEACDMKAAFALGATYDPIMLKKLGATLLDPDVAAARAWYEQARGLGLSEASRQLELLSELSP